jgi:DNA repair protein RadA/Sms
MSKIKTQFVCQSCGYISPRWIGKCAECNSWNSFVEERLAAGPENSRALGARGTNANSDARHPIRLSEISTSEEGRITTGIAELDRALGGGIMPGSIVLVGGDPGIGKSTLMMQMVRGLMPGSNTLYVSGEESPRQLKGRAERLGLGNDNLFILAETNVESVIEAMRSPSPFQGEGQGRGPDLVIVDSIQTMYRPMIESAPGSVSQVRECTALLMQAAKMTGIPVFVVGHVTKEGMIAGPKVLEHIVDTVLMFEGERTHAYRILRAAKNRYGSTNEIGVFSMSGSGLEEVPNPSEVFLSERRKNASGSAVTSVLEGTRPVLIEIQALVINSNYSTPQRTVTGYDTRRVAMLLAVLEKQLGARLGHSDVFINIAGGLFIDEPAADLAIALAVLSNQLDLAIDPTACLIGEIGLGGEVRAVPQAELRVTEAIKLGFQHIVLPRANMKSMPKVAEKITLRPVAHIEEVRASVL